MKIPAVKPSQGENGLIKKVKNGSNYGLFTNGETFLIFSVKN